jgi:cytochrome c biogenesis protein CcmG/thiol:disulfide interchange protein DsbE
VKQKFVITGVVVVAALTAVAIFSAGLLNATQTGKRPVPGSVAPDFRITLFDEYRGGYPSDISLSELRGKVVILNFWASWCIECRKEADVLEWAWREYRNESLVVLGVDYLDTEAAAMTYMRDYGTTYPNGIDQQQSISRLFRITGVPETFIIDKQGIVRRVLLLSLTQSELQAIVEPLLNE